MYGKIGTDMAMVVPILLLFLVEASRCDGSKMGNGSNTIDEWMNYSGDMSNDSNSSLTTDSLTMS